jgi:hypothetical protein
MAGGTQHTAGGGEVEVSLKNALTVGVPITEIHKRPCVRDSLLKGMIGGFAIGGVRIIFGSKLHGKILSTLADAYRTQPLSSKHAVGPLEPFVECLAAYISTACTSGMQKKKA